MAHTHAGPARVAVRRAAAALGQGPAAGAGEGAPSQAAGNCALASIPALALRRQVARTSGALAEPTSRLALCTRGQAYGDTWPSDRSAGGRLAAGLSGGAVRSLSREASREVAGSAPVLGRGNGGATLASAAEPNARGANQRPWCAENERSSRGEAVATGDAPRQPQEAYGQADGMLAGALAGFVRDCMAAGQSQGDGVRPALCSWRGVQGGVPWACGHGEFPFGQRGFVGGNQISHAWDVGMAEGSAVALQGMEPLRVQHALGRARNLSSTVPCGGAPWVALASCSGGGTSGKASSLSTSACSRSGMESGAYIRGESSESGVPTPGITRIARGPHHPGPDEDGDGACALEEPFQHGDTGAAACDVAKSGSQEQPGGLHSEVAEEPPGDGGEGEAGARRGLGQAERDWLRAREALRINRAHDFSGPLHDQSGPDVCMDPAGTEAGSSPDFWLSILRGEGEGGGEGSAEAEVRRFLRVAVVGAPNAGKSSLVNALVNARISAVNRKTNTTRKEVVGISTHGGTQIVYHDTPGLIQEVSGHPLPSEFRSSVRQAWSVLTRCPMLALVVDAERQIRQPDPRVQRLAVRLGTEPVSTLVPSSRRTAGEEEPQLQQQRRVLVLNKVDLVRDKTQLLPLAAHLGNLQSFERTFMVSARKGGRALDDLREFFEESALEGPWEEDPERCTDQSVEELALLMVREAMLDKLHEEVPYKVQQQHVGTRMLRDGSLRVEQRLLVASPNQRGILLGSRGQTIRDIGVHARKHVEQATGRRVHLILDVKVSRR